MLITCFKIKISKKTYVGDLNEIFIFKFYNRSKWLNLL